MPSENSSDFLNSKPTSDELAGMLNAALAELRMTPAELAAHMHINRDYQDFPDAMASIQRMVSGHTCVSGEMLAMVNMILAQRRQFRAKYSDLSWHLNDQGRYSAQVEDWHVHIAPQSKGRWLLWCRHGTELTDYSPPFGAWLNTLEEAKEKALACVEGGMNDVAAYSSQVL